MASDPVLDDISASMGGWDADPASWNKIIAQTAKQYPTVSPQTLYGILQTESSGGRNSSDSSAGAQGPMGILPSTAASAAPGGINPYHPGEAIPAAAKIISDRLATNGGVLSEALRFYEGGHRQGGPVNEAYPGKVLAAGQGYKAPSLASDPFMDDLVGSMTAPAGGATLPNAEVAPQGATAAPTSPAPAPVAASGAPLPPATTPAGGVVPGQPIPAQATGPSQAPTSPQPYPWDAADEWGNALSLGVLPRASAGTMSLLTGQPYSGLRAAQVAGQKQWEGDNSLGGVIADTVGPLPLTLTGLGMAGRGLEAGAGLAARAAPGIANALGGVADATSAAVGPVGRFAGRVAASVGTGAAQGAGAGALDSLLNPGSLGDQMESGAKVGAVLGPFAPLISKVLTPAINAPIAALSQAADALGVRIPVSGMVNGSKNLAAAGSPAGTNELRSYTQALGKQLGLNTNELTPAAIDGALSKAGDDLDNAYSQIHIPQNDQGLATNLQTILRQADSSLASTHVARGQIQKAGQAILDGVTDPNGISGNLYQSLMAKGGPIKALVNNSDGTAQYYGQALQKAVRDAAGRNAPAQAAGVPGLMSQITDANTRYAIGMKLSKAADVAGDTGLINPSAVKSQFMDWDQGGPMNTLAQIAPLLPKPSVLGNAKPASVPINQMLSQYAKPEVISALLGAGAGGFHGGTAEAVGAGLGAAGLTALGHSAARSVANANWYRNMLVDMAMGGSGGTAGRVARALPVAPIVAGTNLMNQTGR